MPLGVPRDVQTGDVCRRCLNLSFLLLHGSGLCRRRRRLDAIVARRRSVELRSHQVTEPRAFLVNLHPRPRQPSSASPRRGGRSPAGGTSRSRRCGRPRGRRCARRARWSRAGARRRGTSSGASAGSCRSRHSRGAPTSRPASSSPRRARGSPACATARVRSLAVGAARRSGLSGQLRREANEKRGVGVEGELRTLSVKAIGHAPNELAIRFPCSSLDLLPRCLWVAVSDVGRDGASEEDGVLYAYQIIDHG